MPPEEAQFLETRKFQVDEIARLFGLPPHLLSHQERQTSWGTGIEQHNLGFNLYTLNPVWLVRIESRLTTLTPTGFKVQHVLQGLLRGDSMQRARFYESMYRMKAMSSDEIRELEDLGEREEDDDTFFDGEIGPLTPLGAGTGDSNDGQDEE